MEFLLVTILKLHIPNIFLDNRGTAHTVDSHTLLVTTRANKQQDSQHLTESSETMILYHHLNLIQILLLPLLTNQVLPQTK